MMDYRWRAGRGSTLTNAALRCDVMELPTYGTWNLMVLELRLRSKADAVRSFCGSSQVQASHYLEARILHF